MGPTGWSSQKETHVLAVGCESPQEPVCAIIDWNKKAKKKKKKDEDLAKCNKHVLIVQGEKPLKTIHSI